MIQSTQPQGFYNMGTAPNYSLPPLRNQPPGLDYLASLDKIQVKQLTSVLETLAGCNRNNKYVLSNMSGQQFLFAQEETNACMRFWCKNERGFLISLTDNSNREVIRISREFKCCSGCCWCAGCCDYCAHEVVVEAPAGNVIGYVKQKGSKWKAHYDILNAEKECVLKVLGPGCVCDGPCCPKDQEFKLLTNDKTTQVGKISKQYPGFLTEMFTDSDQFYMEFPMNLSTKVKATLLAAMFLIDFMYFEKTGDDSG